TIVSPEHGFQPERILRPAENIFGSKNAASLLESSLSVSATKRELERVLGSAKVASMPLSHYDTLNIESLALSQEDKQLLRTRLSEYRAMLRTQGATLHSDNSNFWSPLKSEVSEQTEIVSLISGDILSTETAEMFDVIHAHDWMSLKAVMNLKENTRLPVVLHVHSTEYDRAGHHGNQRIQSLERMGFTAADRLVAVSQLTRRVLVEQYNVSPEKIDVVYNASNLAHCKDSLRSANRSQESNTTQAGEERDPVISFVGRVTYQKGPAYFVQAAQRALQLNDRLKFQVIGTGDLLPSMRQLAWELGISDKFTFHGFQSAKKVESLLAQSDVFVMPSVSEPFGIVALEAMAQHIPIIISKQSGVAECLMHALKVDFWDTDLMADRIVSLIRRPALRGELQRNGARETDRFTWEASAQRCTEVYHKTYLGMQRT
ncbi:MAG: hypothetical protein RJB13_2487, partial [Pseudomonadota bacterium]